MSASFGKVSGETRKKDSSSLPLLDRLGGDADYDCVRFDALGYYCAGADHRPVADMDALQNGDAGADPHIFSQSHRRAGQGLLRNEQVLLRAVVMVGDVTVWTDEAAFAELDALGCVKHCESVDVAAATDDDARLAFSLASGQENHVVVEHSFSDVDVPRVSRHADSSNPAPPAQPHAEEAQPEHAAAHRGGRREADEEVDQAIRQMWFSDLQASP